MLWFGDSRVKSQQRSQGQGKAADGSMPTVWRCRCVYYLDSSCCWSVNLLKTCMSRPSRVHVCTFHMCHAFGTGEPGETVNSNEALATRKCKVFAP